MVRGNGVPVVQQWPVAYEEGWTAGCRLTYLSPFPDVSQAQEAEWPRGAKGGPSCAPGHGGVPVPCTSS